MTSKYPLRFNILFTAHIARFFQLLFIGLTLHLFIISCTQKTTEEEEAAIEPQEATASENNKTLVFCSEGSPEVFNPQTGWTGTVFDATHHIYERLFDFKYGTTEVIPSLIEEEWTVDDKGLEYTFDLKKGVKFHSTPYFTPTRDLSVDDVLFSFNRQKDSKHPYHNVGSGTYQYFQSMQMDSIIEDIVKVNDHRVKFILSEPNAPFIANLAMDFASILSKEYADQLLAAKTPEKIDHQPIGNGSFVLKEYIRDTSIRFEAFEDYFSKRGNIKNLIFAITPDANVRLQKLRSNECQIITYPAPADLEAIRRDTNLALIEQPGFNVGYLAMNTEKKPLDNKWVRQAINHALNKKAYLQAVYLGNAEIAKNPLPPKSWGYHKGITGYDYNVEKAKALLKKAGLPKGFETDLWVLPVARPYIPSGKKLGEMMQADLAKVGIKTRILTYDWPTYIDKVGKGEHSLGQFGWTGDNGDPDNFLYLLSCGSIKGKQNLARWCHTPFNNLITRARVITDKQRTTRLQMYKEAQTIFKEEAPWALLFHSTVHRGMRKNVSGYKIDPLGRNIFTYVEMK